MKSILTTCLFIYLLEVCHCFHKSGTTVPFEHMDRWMIIDYHNSLRRDVRASNMQEMSWDRLAARAARRFSQGCDTEAPREGLYGENLFYSSAKPDELPKEVMMDAMQYWSRDKNSTINARQDCGTKMECNYLQIITANVEGVGCSIAKCPKLKLGENKQETNVNLVTCLYIPRINIKSLVPYRSGEACTHCKPGFSCRNKLCSPPTVPVGELKFGSEFDASVIELKVEVKTLRPPKPTMSLISKPEAEVEVRDYSPITQESTSSVDIKQNNRSPGSNYRGRSHAELRRRPMSRRYFDNRGHLRLRSTVLRGIPARDTVAPGTPSRGISSRTTLQQRQRPISSRNWSSRRPTSRRNIRRFGELVSGSGRVKRQALDSHIRRLERERLIRDRERERQRRQRQRQPSRILRRQEEEERRRRLQERERQRQELMRQRNRLQPGRQRSIDNRARTRTNEGSRDRRLNRRPARQRRPQPQRAVAGALTDNDQHYLLQMHNTIRPDGLPKLEWSSRLERWAKYVIRCDIQYPGPSNCYTNFGKIDASNDVYATVYDWSADVQVMRGRGGNCRTPNDRAPCNRNTNMKSEFIREMACAAMSCGRQKQVTCIYQ